MTWHEAKKVQLVPVVSAGLDKRIAYWSLVIDDVVVGSIFGVPGCGFPMAMIERADGSREIVDQNEAKLSWSTIGDTLDVDDDDERYDGSMRSGIARYFRGAP
jgi:hypothetical protein